MAVARPPRWGNAFTVSRRTGRRIRIVITVVAVCIAISLVTGATPWPSALLIRSVFEAGGKATQEEMEPYVPDTKLTTHSDVSYGTDGADTTLDAYTPASATTPLPTIVWIHGGAWISGSKENVDPYLRILASHNYTTIGVNYTVGPNATYPTAVNQLNEALRYINEHADELNVDPTQIVLAGDSAGAQLASQLATLTVNPDYANLLGITPALTSSQLAGTILNCGVYNMDNMAALTGIVGWGFKISLWGYTGTKNWSETYAGNTMSTMNFVTKDFPPTFISGGNGDGLTWLQSVPMSHALQQAGVDVTELFWPADHEPSLPHEYQFHLKKFEDAHTALNETVTFLQQHTH
ncbi:alpha/beta hydrolase [Leifsonia sp. Root112D2]|uniref:alpha/beta hydrolase n=1 Tax=Leifsonia sp. Root112D2 TaxID=1736426 RepID=UPI0006FD368E|nr:alpha/beta hydrolase [Leifsonia sp. Root112D2]KQV06922.1 esterase [Leifsonia sp. Root112D2]